MGDPNEAQNGLAWLLADNIHHLRNSFIRDSVTLGRDRAAALLTAWAKLEPELRAIIKAAPRG